MYNVPKCFLIGEPAREPIVISISRNGLLKACARFFIERSEIRNKQHAYKSVHFECRIRQQDPLSLFIVIIRIVTLLLNKLDPKILCYYKLLSVS